MNATQNTNTNAITIKTASPVDAASFARLHAAGFAWNMAAGAFIATDSDQARALAAEFSGQPEPTPPGALYTSGEQTDEDTSEPSELHHSGEEIPDSGELCEDIERATYSPEDNKIRIYPTRRLDAEIYARVKAAGFKWAPKQGVFVAPMWTPARADLAESLAGELGDEDTTLAERATERAERFEEYHGKRAADAESARRGVDAIAQNIPFGQPILIGHHSERHARRDAQRIEDGMRRAVKMWDTAEYWTRRAAGAIRHAKYKELPAVRARRIKKIEAAQRGHQRGLDKARALLALWNREGLTLAQARAIANGAYFNVLHENGHYWTAYQVLQPDGERFKACPAWTVDQVQAQARAFYPRSIAFFQRWINHYQNRLAYERAMLNQQGAAHLLETPKRPAPPPMLNYRAPEGFTLPNRWHRGEFETLAQIDMTKAEYLAIHEERRGTRTIDGHRIRVCLNLKTHHTEAVFLTDSKTHPRPVKAAPDATKPEPTDTSAVHTSGEQTDTGGDVETSGEDTQKTAADDWTPVYSPYRHGGWYVSNIHYKGGAVGCVSNNYLDKKWRIVCDKRRGNLNEPGDFTYKTRDEAARAEREIAAATHAEPAPAPEPTPTPPANPAAPFAAMRDSLRAGVQVITAPQLFPTHAALAARMVELANIQPGVRVLEPSAGTGRLLDAISAAQPNAAHVVAVEINATLAGRLDDTGRAIVCGDFLKCDTAALWGNFDRVVMNPPFTNAADIQHIQHAASMLKPGGRLVALCANGPRQRAALQPLASYWEDLPAGTFAESGTGVNVALLIIDAPAATGTDDDTSAAHTSGEQTNTGGDVVTSGEDSPGTGMDPTRPENYAQIFNNPALLEWFQDTLDDFFGRRTHAIRSALSGLAWSAAPYKWPMFKDYDYRPFRIRTSVDTVGAGRNVVGMSWRVEDDAGRVLIRLTDDLSHTPEQIAAELDNARKTTPPESISEADKVHTSGEQQAPTVETGAPFDAGKFYSELREILTAAGWKHNKTREHIEDGEYFIYDNNSGLGATGEGWAEWRIFVNHWNTGTGGGWVPSAEIHAQHKTPAHVAAEIIAATTPTPSGEQIDSTSHTSGEAPQPESSAPLIPGRWIPGGADKAERIAFDTALGVEVWLMDMAGKLSIIAYRGKRTKRDAYYLIKDRERALQWAAKYLADAQADANRQAERRADKKAKRAAGHKLTVGDVLRSSWGYDQTNIDYYEVTKLIGKSMVEIRKIGRESIESGSMTGECVPPPGHYIGEPMRKTVSDYDGQSVRIASYAHAYKIEPQEVGGVKVYPVDHWTAYA